MNKDSVTQFPNARKDKLIIKELPNETLVYDLETDKAHCLNETAARVWKNCDGRKTVAQLRELMEKEANSPVPEEVVWLALNQLEKFELLDKTASIQFPFAGINRRELVRRIGLGALALPLIISMAAPPAQAQGSLLPPGACCQNGPQCQSGLCNVPDASCPSPMNRHCQ